MARRMFSPKITSTDAFLDMPVSVRELYFQLGMNADDDGFITPKRIMRMIGATDDDLKVLIGKGFVIPFQSGVIVISAWKINNLIRKDWYQETIYKEEKAQLVTGENGEYKLVNEMLPSSSTQVRLGKVRLGNDNTRPLRGNKTTFNPLGAEILKAFEVVDPKNKTYYGNKTQRAACDFLLDEYGLEKTLKLTELLPQINQKKLYIRQITTPYELKENWVKIANAIEQSKDDGLKHKVAFS